MIFLKLKKIKQTLHCFFIYLFTGDMPNLKKFCEDYDEYVQNTAAPIEA